MKPRSIIHLNIADFAARVETCLAPSLKDSPLVIAPLGAPRAVVYDMNEQAFREGIRKGMPLSRVKRLHRGIPILPPRFNRYEQVMAAIVKQGLAYTPTLESGPLDGHLFLDITGTSRLYGPPPDVAFRLKKSIQKAMGLDPIWSIATNKLVAKVATRVVKPLGEYIVGPGEEAAFLAPLPVSLLPGLTLKEIQTITRFNLVQISQVRSLTPAQLSVPFPGQAHRIRGLLRGEDLDPVAQSSSTTLKVEHEFINDTNEADELKAGIILLAADLTTQLRHQKKSPKKLSLTLSYSDGIYQKNSLTAQGNILFKQGWSLFLRTWKRRVRIRHIRLSCDTTPAAHIQPDLFPTKKSPKETRKNHLTEAMDKIKEQFGKAAVQPASALALKGSKPCSP